MNRFYLLLAGAALIVLALMLFPLSQAVALFASPQTPPGRSKDTTANANPKRTVSDSKEDERAIRKQVETFSAAFNKGDLEGILAVWSEEGEFIHESGRTYRGKPALRVMLQKALEGFKGYKQTIKVEAVRFIRPDVALEEGTVTMTSPENVSDVGKYSSVWVKQEGKWLLSRVRDLPNYDEPEKPVAFSQLKQLHWILGQWQDKEGKGVVQMNCKWAHGQAFFLQEFVLKQPDDKEFHVTQWIGWDPVNQQVRSWMFDSAGGFALGWWTRSGNTWTIESEGVYPDGRMFSSTDTLKYLNDDAATWTSRDRQADEQPLPDVELNFVRKAKGR